MFETNDRSDRCGDVEEERFINIVERSLLHDLVSLYTCDLSREEHSFDGQCLASAKERIVSAIREYIGIDESIRGKFR